MRRANLLSISCRCRYVDTKGWKEGKSGMSMGIFSVRWVVIICDVLLRWTSTGLLDVPLRKVTFKTRSDEPIHPAARNHPSIDAILPSSKMPLRRLVGTLHNAINLLGRLTCPWSRFWWKYKWSRYRLRTWHQRCPTVLGSIGSTLSPLGGVVYA